MSRLALLPSQCEVCRGWGHGLVCSACTARFAPAQVRCPCCGLARGAEAAPGSTPEGPCGACLSEASSFAPYVRTVCALDYAFPWDRLVTAFKFQHRVELAVPLAALLGTAVDRESDLRPDLVVPVPLAPARLAERGYNQAWELARPIARQRGWRALPDALLRVLDTPTQAALTRAERQRNLRNAFAPAPGAPLAGADIALVDDVMTTGATAHEAARALLRGGARSVQLWVLARTPAPFEAST